MAATASRISNTPASKTPAPATTKRFSGGINGPATVDLSIYNGANRTGVVSKPTKVLSKPIPTKPVPKTVNDPSKNISGRAKKIRLQAAKTNRRNVRQSASGTTDKIRREAAARLGL